MDYSLLLSNYSYLSLTEFKLCFLAIHNMDNKVRPTRIGPFEALIGTVQDTFLLGMNQQQTDHNNKNDNQPKQLLRFKKPIETLGFIYEEVPTFDTEYAREFG
jgi:hypothetical protein